MAQEIADSTLLDTWASSGLIVEPDISKIIEGWQLGEQPPHEYMNWLQNTFGSKLNHILKNGVAKWENEKEFLAGATVQHNGNIWLCKTTNTNSEPADVNANWKRIITIEALTSLLAGYVALTGNQTIAGVKTFSSSPIVPTPTTGTQAANKDYADLKVALAEFTGANQSLAQSGYQKLPGGLIVQWGITTTNAAGTSVVTFPISFPNGQLRNFATLYTNIVNSPFMVGTDNGSQTQLTVTACTTSGAGESVQAKWLAIGY